MSTGVKILTLAFHPSTPESEAIAAFLKARRQVPENPDFSVLFNPKTPEKTKYDYYNQSYRSAMEDKDYKSYKLKIKVLKFPLFIHGINTFKKDAATPFYSFEILSSEWQAVGMIEVKFKIYFDSVYESNLFDNYLPKLISTINDK